MKLLIFLLVASQAPERSPEAATLAVEVLAQEAERRARPGDAGPSDAGDDDGDGGPAVEVLDAGPSPAELEIERRKRAEEAERRAAELQVLEARQAQRQAEERAQKARTVALERALSQVAFLEGMKANLGARKASVHAQTAARLSTIDAERAAAEEELKRARAIKKASAAVDAQFDAVLVAQAKAIESTLEALRRREATSMTDAQAKLDGLERLVVSADPEVRAAQVDRDETVLEISALMASITEAERRGWLEVAGRQIQVATLYDEARLLLLHRVSGSRAIALRGISEVAGANLSVAVSQIEVAARFHLLKRVNDVRELPTLLKNRVELASIAWAFTQLLFAALLALWLWRKVPALYERVRKGWLGSGRSRARLRLIGSALAIVEDVGPTLALIALWTWGYRQVKPIGPMPELRFAYDIAIWVLVYQVAAKLSHRLVLRLVRRRHSLNSRAKLKVIRTVRAILRYIFAVAWSLTILRALVGAGILYSSARAVTLAGLFVVFLLLVRRWREEIISTYITRWPSTRLAALIEPRREKVSGFVLAVFALVVVSGRAIAVLARDFVLGFDQTRVALAYVFRARIERSARERGRVEVKLEDLPEAVRTAFVDEPCDRAALLVPRFDAMKELTQRAAGDQPFVALLSGPAGIGRTTWIDKLCDELPGDQIRLAVTTRVLTERRVAQVLSAELGLEEATDCDPIVEYLRSERRTIVVDGLEWLFLRGLGGYDALDAFLHMIEETRETTSWLVSTSGMSRRFLARARGLDEHFPTRIELKPWSEAEIRDLIDRRQRASGIDVNFTDLMVGESTAMVDTAQVVETRAGYIRLLWSFAEGNPRVCQYFWLRSLRPSTDGLHVQLYEAPAADDLEVLGELDRFLLQTVALHRALLPAEIARTCNVTRARAEAHVYRGLESGLYHRTAQGRVEVTTAWWEATVRYLRRKNLGS